MPSDPTKPLLRLTPRAEQDRAPGRQGRGGNPQPFDRGRQTGTFGPKFIRLAEVLARDPAGLELRADPASLAPERLLVFEVRGSIATFAAAVRNVPGLELIDEEELEADDGDSKPVAYLLVPDVRALQQIESLWRHFLNGTIPYGYTPWREVFGLLRDLRPWGPSDRVRAQEGSILSEEIEDQPDDYKVRLEVELVYRANAAAAARQVEAMRGEIAERGGQILSTARIDSISYDAMLVELPAVAVRRVILHEPDSIAGLEQVMHIRPQSVASSIDVVEGEAGARVDVVNVNGDPILAVLDGVPVAGHALLAQRIIIDDQFDLEPTTPVADRVHGTAMASLVIHGDRNKAGVPLTRPIHFVPVMGASDKFPTDQLIVDVIYRAVLGMREGADATAPNVIIVNISLGNCNRRFQGQMSAWARLLDQLAYRFGILFIVYAAE